MLVDPGYGEFIATGTHPHTGWTLPGPVPRRFRYEVLGMHRRVTGLADVRGRPQLAWPRALGTPPWAVAHQMSATSGADLPAATYVVRPALTDRGDVFDRVVRATGDRRPVPVFVGSGWAPRHVVLGLGLVEDRLRCYEPAEGRLVDVGRDDFVSARLGLAGWDHPWFVVLPR